MRAAFIGVLASIVGLAPACVKIAPFSSGTGDAPNGDASTTDGDVARACLQVGPDLLATTTIDGRILVCGANYTMQFSDRGFYYPDHLTIDGTDVLAPGDSCVSESGMGIDLY